MSPEVIFGAGPLLRGSKCWTENVSIFIREATLRTPVWGWAKSVGADLVVIGHREGFADGPTAYQCVWNCPAISLTGTDHLAK